MPDAVAILEQQAILYPRETIAAAQAGGLDLAVMCATLNRESRLTIGGRTASGWNVWGSDRVKGQGYLYASRTEITEPAWRRYVAARKAGTAGYQGAGGLQITWYTLQDRADALGGGHLPRYSLQVGAEEMARCLKVAGGNLRDAGARYNGGKAYDDPRTSSAAREYGEWLESHVAPWRQLLAGTAPGSAGDSSVLQIGSSGDRVAELQRVLNAWYGRARPSWYPLGEDGAYGPNTAAAVRYYQQAARIGVDGVAGPVTLRGLGLA